MLGRSVGGSLRQRVSSSRINSSKLCKGISSIRRQRIRNATCSTWHQREVRGYAAQRSQRRHASGPVIRVTVLARCPLHGGDKSKKLRKEMSERNSTAHFGAGRKRGHQHHPRHSGVRRSNVPSADNLAQLRADTSNITQENSNIIPAADSNRNFSSAHTQHLRDGREESTLSQRLPRSKVNEKQSQNALAELSSVDPDNNNRVLPSSSALCDKNVCGGEIVESQEKIGSNRNDQPSSHSPTSGKKTKNSDSKRRRLRQAQEITKQEQTVSADAQPSTEDIDTENDPEAAEWAKLRCTSERTEVIAEREYRRQNRRCADYPGLAFGRSIFSSDTMMKFSIIRNELHNIMKTQLKRAESEVAALNRRIQLLEEDLERSEERLASATAKLAEASQAADESERIRKALENRTNMEDDRVAILEAQLAQAKLIAEEADKKYEEVARKLVLMEQDLERSEEKVELSESKIVELEEELRVVGNNLKSLEVSEEKATATRESAEDKITSLNQKLSSAEARAEFAERSVQKLQKEVDRLEDDLVIEKEKYKDIGDDLDTAFVELILKE
ncbi:myosin heavy chain isoform X5 [Lutzomyia longipalpis]|uniref:myosin heavy chain isoform X5 n=1 Tax=Lutzomyia longipalpis TaxID=7200 RepID=UPI00248455C9|nr:myosin heavy chain isoform X5 [Lutzomyia longipalpis]